MQNPPPVQMMKSSTGLDENVAAVLSYLFQWASGLVFFLIEKDSRLVRFHAMQSLILFIAAYAGFIVLMIVWFVISIVVSQISGLIGSMVSLLVLLVIMIFGAAVVVAWIIGMVKAFQGQYFKLPVIGNFAEKFSTK